MNLPVGIHRDHPNNRLPVPVAGEEECAGLYPVGITGVAFCGGCGLGRAYRADLFVGANNDGRIRRFDLNSTRRGFGAGPLLVLDRPGPVLSLEVGPSGRIFFSDFSAPMTE